MTEVDNGARGWAVWSDNAELLVPSTTARRWGKQPPIDAGHAKRRVHARVAHGRDAVAVQQRSTATTATGGGCQRPPMTSRPASRTAVTIRPGVRDEEVVPDACRILRGTKGNTGGIKGTAHQAAARFLTGQPPERSAITSAAQAESASSILVRPLQEKPPGHEPGGFFGVFFIVAPIRSTPLGPADWSVSSATATSSDVRRPAYGPCVRGARCKRARDDTGTRVG